VDVVVLLFGRAWACKKPKPDSLNGGIMTSIVNEKHNRKQNALIFLIIL